MNGCQIITTKRGNSSNSLDFKEVYSLYRFTENLRITPNQFLMVGNSLKSDIQPVLALGGYAMHIPFEIMWQHEVVEHFEHPRLYQLKKLGELTKLLQLTH